MDRELRSCFIKTRYDTKRKAKEGRVRLRHREDCQEPGTLEVYYCHFCRGWHIGHRVKKKAGGTGANGSRLAM